ncbi:MAG: ornithine carbamoyltransferase [candidate division KSB1 bacterium]|nr:ornithine carbamoyltransferase [candidate division KSB1 bacterium]
MKKDFVTIADWSTEEILQTFDLARELKARFKAGEVYHPLKGKTLAMVFQKPSNRTRVSFEVGMYQLGGHALYLGPAEIGLGKRESVADVARVLARYVDGIMARVFDHDHVVQLAEWASVPVINGLSDLVHPCQIMGDMLTIIEHRGRFEGVHVAWVGDGNNVCHSWLNLAAKIPFKLSIATPEGYEPKAEFVERARAAGVSEIFLYHSAEEAVRGAEFVYTDVWASMGQEEEAEKRSQVFAPFQVNESLLKLADPNVKFLHCLPAHRGEEVTDEVMDGPHSIVFDQAENRLHIQKAIMVKLMSEQA